MTRARDELLDPEHGTEDLRALAVRGGITVAAVQASHFALNLLSTVILARLLAPRDFGLLVMVTAVTNLLTLFRDVGLGSATIQRADLTHAQLSALFWINSALGFVIAALLGLTAPLLARFYEQPDVQGIAVALSLGFVVAGFGVQHAALLRRQMRFGAIAVAEVGSHAVGLAAAVIGAKLNAGYWSLVIFQLVQQTGATCAVWLSSSWRPDWRPSVAGVGPLLSFGAGLTGFNLLTYLARNLDNVILGRAAGSVAVGTYAKAYSLLLLPVDRIRGPISSVMVPALSRLQGDPPRFRAAFLKALVSMVSVGMPVVVFLFVFAEEAILVVLGPQWQESILLFRVLAPAAFVETFNTVGSWACIPLGRSGRLVRWQMVATTIMAAAFFVGSRWGSVGIAGALSIATVALRLPAVVYLLRDSPVRPMEIYLALVRPAGASIASGAVMAALHHGLANEVSDFMLLIVAAPVFASVYLLFLSVLPGGRQHLRESWALLRLRPRPYTFAGTRSAGAGQ
jgi:PST family polysaccharide transporter